jgi:hypothetical protein
MGAVCAPAQHVFTDATLVLSLIFSITGPSLTVPLAVGRWAHQHTRSITCTVGGEERMERRAAALNAIQR